MIHFYDFPSELQFTDNDIANMSLEKLAHVFTIAQQTLLKDDLERWERRMWSAIERCRLHPSTATLQSVVKHLENYKRSLGRQYNAQHNMRIMLKYDEVERDIRWLANQYGLSRISKPYFLNPTCKHIRVRKNI